MHLVVKHKRTRTVQTHVCAVTCRNVIQPTRVRTPVVCNGLIYFFRCFLSQRNISDNVHFKQKILRDHRTFLVFLYCVQNKIIYLFRLIFRKNQKIKAIFTCNVVLVIYCWKYHLFSCLKTKIGHGIRKTRL